MKWDLFNPIPEFNYKEMSAKLDVELLENPYIQVVWEDTPENFTQERIKSVKQYFQKKYNSTNINVITKVKTTEDTQQTIDVSVNIMDKNYQKELIKSMLESKGQEQYYDQVMTIDSAVENRLAANDVEVTAFKKWHIKKIEFSNFLSYGENQVIDFDQCNGITVVESDPPNFGGKTVLTVDLLLFLFFNTTTKTQKAEEIFNRFTDKNVVSVKVTSLLMVRNISSLVRLKERNQRRGNGMLKQNWSSSRNLLTDNFRTSLVNNVERPRTS